jgi:hypothetical protein
VYVRGDTRGFDAEALNRRDPDLAKKYIRPSVSRHDLQRNRKGEAHDSKAWGCFTWRDFADLIDQRRQHDTTVRWLHELWTSPDWKVAVRRRRVTR